MAMRSVRYLGLLCLLSLPLGCEWSGGRDPADGNAYYGPDYVPVWNLYRAIERGELAAVKQAIDNGMSPSLHIEDKGSILGWSVLTGRDEIALFLISRGADINYVTRSERGGGATPLIDAIIANRCLLAKALLSAGADPSIRFMNAGAATMGELENMTALQIFEYNRGHLQNYTASDPVCWSEVEALMKQTSAGASVESK
jgi:hypothetical protein